VKSSRTWLILAVLAIAATVIYFIISQRQREDNLRSIRNNWSSYIYVKEFHYKYSSLGGVDPFEIPVVNNTDHFIDEITISIKYIKASGGTYKTENIAINNIPPHAEKTALAPQSPRGTSVAADISEVISRSMQFCYPGIRRNLYDPYQCN
jgi:hypothetical protein